jgi:regulatory protein
VGSTFVEVASDIARSCDNARMAKRRDIGKLKDEVGTFDTPIGAVQLPSSGIRYDKRGNPKALQSGQDEHPEAGPRERRPRQQPEPELAFTTDLFADDPEQRSVLTACHKALAGTQLTVAELRRKLAKKDFDEAAIEHGIERCIAAGLLDDERYATAYLESRVRRGHGAMRIRQDLGQRGIDRQLIEALLAEHQDDGALDAAAVDAARKKFARIDLDDAPARAKAMRWLLSRGYSSSQADAALRAVRQERADDAS